MNPMKNSRIIPLLALLLLMGIAAFSLIPRNSAPPKSVVIPATTTDANTGATPASGSAPAAVTPSAINPKDGIAQPAPTAPEKVPDAPAPTKPETKSEPKPMVKVIEMPATTPQPPPNFYPSDVATNRDYSFRFRAGYQHANYHDNNDTYWLSVKFAACGERFRHRAGKNGWLVPDADVEFSHQDLAKKSGGTDEGLQLDVNAFWPWFNWVMNVCSRTNVSCPYSGPLKFTLGPVANVGFDQLFDGTSPQNYGHGGARLTLNRDGFIEYIFGGAENLGGVRQRLVGELPLYQSRDHQVRYLVRGVWDHTTGSQPDLLQGAFLVEMPLDFITTPSKWNDLVPFKK
jgi:hypothetical protein